MCIRDSHTVVNRLMIAGSGLESLCHIADTPDEMVCICRKLMHTDMAPESIEQRRDFLYPTYSNQYQGEHLLHLIYEV